MYSRWMHELPGIPARFFIAFLMKRYLILLLILGTAALVFLSCEKENGGTIDPPLAAPFLTSLGLSHSQLNLDLDTTGSVLRDTLRHLYQISLTVSGTALTKGTSGPFRGTLSLTKTGETSAFLRQEIPLREVGPDTLEFSSDITFQIARSDAGVIRFDLAVQSASAQLSNSIEQSLLVTRLNSAPEITKIVMPDSVTVGKLPAPDSTFLVQAVVTDSDGVADIDHVEFLSMKPDSSFANCGSAIPLFDDGSEVVVFPPNITSGDLVAGDGIYSIRVRLVTWSLNRCPPPDTSYTQRGYYTFTFFATDKSGATDTLSQRIKVK
jgi:hypothetical protein